MVTGTLVSGRIRVDDRLMLSPPGIELRVRGLHAQNRPAEEAVAGQRAALNVAGSRLSKDAVNRGDWVLHPGCMRQPRASTSGSHCWRKSRRALRPMRRCICMLARRT